MYNFGNTKNHSSLLFDVSQVLKCGNKNNSKQQENLSTWEFGGILDTEKPQLILPR